MADPPSTYMPFSRWFTNEKQRELDETERLYWWVKARQDSFTETPESLGGMVFEYFGHLSTDLRRPMIRAVWEIMKSERFIFDLPPPTFQSMNLKEFVQYRNLLRAKQYFFTNERALLQLLQEGLARVFAGLAEQLPQTESPSPFTIPLVYTLEEPALDIERKYGTLTSEEYYDRGLFRPIAEQFHRNICAASGRDPNDQNSRKPIIHASESKLPLNEIVDTYLKGTPFHALYALPVPLRLSRDDRMNHMHIVGGTGAGKTSLLERLILHDIGSEDSPSLVIIDPHSDLVERLIHADIGIEDRLIYINPRDIDNPPALNVFAMNQERMANYDEATKEQVAAGVIQTFDYLFTGLLGADLTAKQGVFFRYVARLMLSLPETLGRNATILDMIKLMSDDTPYRDAIERLPPISRDFFIHDFRSKTFEQTKEQIRYRLQAIIENPTIARLFTSPETKVDLFTEMNRGAIIVVDTAKDFLKTGHANFGRIFISLVLQAVLERSAIPEHRRKDTFLIIDEAASYFDSNIDDLLTDARKYRCGCVFAHQHLSQASHALRASLASNTGSKFVSGVSANDARVLAAEMRTTADFILGQPRLQFAAHIKGVTPHAVSIPVKPGALASLPTLPRNYFEELIELNRERVSLSVEQSRPPEPPQVGGLGVVPGGPPNSPRPPQTVSSSEPDEDISSGW